MPAARERRQGSAPVRPLFSGRFSPRSPQPRGKEIAETAACLQRPLSSFLPLTKCSVAAASQSSWPDAGLRGEHADPRSGRPTSCSPPLPSLDLPLRLGQCPLVASASLLGSLRGECGVGRGFALGAQRARAGWAWAMSDDSDKASGSRRAREDEASVS